MVDTTAPKTSPDVAEAQPERPIQSKEDDALSRDQFVRRLTNALINPQTKKSSSVVIGVTGPWGSGKSSLLNLVREHIKATYSDAIIITFDPWLVSGRNDLIYQFLGEVLATIKSEPILKS